MSDGVELRWPGKYDADGRRRPIERIGATLRTRARYLAGTEPAAGPPNRLIEGDNLLSLEALAAEAPGSVDLAYIDPPFATGGRFEVVTPVGPGPKGRVQLRQPAYSDRFAGGTAGLLAVLDPRLRLIHELLAPHGSLYVHVDPTVGHAVKLLLDEIFGPASFSREIVWRIGWVSGFKTKARNWIRNHDLIFFYVKDPARFTFNKHYMPHPPGYRRRDGSLPKGKGVPIDDVWNAGDAELALRGAQSLDSIQIKSFSTEKTGYATQKNESVLRRIVETSSNPGDLVLDAFCGSGTTMAVAEALGRRWIGCDTGRAAIEIATARMLASERRRDFEVASVAHDERRLAEGHRSAVWLHEIRSRIAAGAEPLEVKELATECPEAGRSVAAWRWEVPVQPAGLDGAERAAVEALLGEDVVESAWRVRETAEPSGAQWVLGRELLGRGGAGPGAGMRARVGVVVVRRADGWCVVLESFEYPDDAPVPDALRREPIEPLDWVEWWAVAVGGCVRGGMSLRRAERQRGLRVVSPVVCLGDDEEIEVLVHDVLHREHRLRLAVHDGGGGAMVVGAVAVAGGGADLVGGARPRAGK